MRPGIELVRKIAMAYGAVCKPLCQTLDLPQTAFDILMLLGNNPEYKTASDIVEIRHIKANLVSIHVDRLVREGYLQRKPVAGDRRKTELCLTERAAPVVAQGRELQRQFFDGLFQCMESETREAFFGTLRHMEENLNRILEEAK